MAGINSKTAPITAYPVGDIGLLYVMVRKAASMSVKKAIETAAGQKINGCAVYDASRKSWPSALRFTVVRNPWERAASCWASKIGEHGSMYGSFRDYGMWKDMTLKDFLLKIKAMPVLEHDAHWAPMCRGLISNGELCVDMILRHESLCDDWARLMTLFPSLPELQHVGYKKSNALRDYYNAETWGLVEDIYADDIKMFGYSGMKY